MGNALSHFRCLFTVVNTASVHAKRRESMWCILWQRLCLGKQIPVSFCNLFTLNSIGYTSGRGSAIYNQQCGECTKCGVTRGGGGGSC